MIPLEQTKEVKEIEFATCKLVFPHGTTKDQVETLLKKHTKHWTIATYCEESFIGCLHIAYAVVDVPEAVMSELNNEPVVNKIDLMNSFKKRPSGAECCEPGH